MRGFIMYDNGRLRTGRISLLLFFSLLLSFGAIFSLQKPVDKAVVVVRHIFAATPKAEAQKVPLKEPEKAAPQPRQEPVKLAQTAPVEKVEEVKNSKVKEKLEASPEKPASAQSQPKKPESQKAESVVEELSQTVMKTARISAPAAAVADIPAKQVTPTTAPVSEKPEPVVKKKFSQNEKPLTELKDETATKDENIRKEKVEPQKISVQAKIESEEQVIDYQQDWQPEVKPKSATVSLMSDAARQRLRENLSRNSVPPEPVKSSEFTAVRISATKKAGSKKAKAKIKTKSEPLVDRSELKRAITTNSKKPLETQSITVEKDEYATLHRAWRAVGEGEKENNRLIPLRIENLRSAYNFLQMKAVVIMADESCIDLSDGSRIPAASLDRFSSTVIQVDDPWQKWGAELRRAGLRPGQSIEVRYYLYDFVRRSIYARVNQAYTWSLNQGKLESGTKPADIDVLGRAYVVKRSGGGSFGVFVPLSLATRDGRIINVDPLCFSNAPDIAALHADGII
ncbi:MAG: hypothetical protein U9N63_06905 [Pseudomonadota bacterium]|nr:hypothetical protein [Pseudomonadota bacterium]